MNLLKVTTHERRLDTSSRPHTARREYYQATRVYFEFKGETIVDDLMNRRERPHKLLKPFVDLALKEVNGQGGVTVPEDVKSRWSQYAGCSCPCSPGFVLTHTLSSDAAPIDIWIQVGEPDAPKPLIEMSVTEGTRLDA